MGRRNSRSTIEAWDRKAPAAPYRASIDGNASWDTDRIAPHVMAAARISPGGRMLMAFELAEVRDLFVESHADQGCQVEPNDAVRASPRVGRAAEDLTVLPMDDLIARLAEANGEHRSAELAVDVLYMKGMSDLLEAKDPAGALRLVSGIPSNCVAKTFCLDALNKTVPIASIPRTDGMDAGYTAEQATACLAWLKVDNERRRIEDAVAPLARAHVKALMTEGRTDEADAFLKAFPASVLRAFLHDVRSYPVENGVPAP